MRLHTPLSLSPSLCLAAAALLPAATPASAAPAPTCSAADRFPLTSRIHGGPDTYRSDDGYGTWYLDITNTTTRTCAAIHPVVVLVDAKRALKPSQVHLEFSDGRPGGRAHPVPFVHTDEDELVGPFDDGFPGFTVGPHRTVSVTVRLAFARDAVPNEVTANAAVVQRHQDDGDWVGQSDDYHFRVEDGPEAAPPDASSASPGGIEDLPFADELARTGLGTPGGLLAAAASAILVAGGAVLLLRRPGSRR